MEYHALHNSKKFLQVLQEIYNHSQGPRLVIVINLDGTFIYTFKKKHLVCIYIYYVPKF